MFAFLAQISWTTADDDDDHLRDAIAAPCILERANASVCFGAVNDTLPAISLEAIATMCGHQRAMFLLKCPDGVSYIKRMVRKRAQMLPWIICFLYIYIYIYIEREREREKYRIVYYVIILKKHT